MKLLTTRVASRTSTIVDSKRWSNDTLNAGGQKDLSNLMKIKYVLFVKSIVILSSGVPGFLLSVSSYAFANSTIRNWMRMNYIYHIAASSLVNVSMQN